MPPPEISIPVSERGRTGLLWSSIGLAVLTSLVQGMVTTIVTIAEDQGMWTFRFRIARFEHHWWTAISILLATSFALIVLSFLSGNNNDSVGVLALSTATAIAIVRYAVPSWRNRHFIFNRWLAWTGNSRTGVSARFAAVCGDADKWLELNTKNRITRAPPLSDSWGIAFRSPPGIVQDPTAILEGLGELDDSMIYSQHWEIGPSLFDDGYHESGHDSLSLLWGEAQGFRRRVSRAINSLPSSLLSSRPHTIDGYNGDGLCLAMGILGRNKGLRPKELVFDEDDTLKTRRGITRINASNSTTSALENTSTWYPRPNKVMRTYYYATMNEQYSSLSMAFVAAATELALLLLDCSPYAINEWLGQRMEQQSLELNLELSRPGNMAKLSSPRATDEQLQTLYRAQYVSMVLSLNYYPHTANETAKGVRAQTLVRPDLHCFALLYLAEHMVKPRQENNGGESRNGWIAYTRGDGVARPSWWDQEWVRARLNKETASLSGNWRQCAAWLLGLPMWPTQLEDWPSWPSDLTYEPGQIS